MNNQEREECCTYLKRFFDHLKTEAEQHFDQHYNEEQHYRASINEYEISFYDIARQSLEEVIEESVKTTLYFNTFNKVARPAGLTD